MDLPDFLIEIQPHGAIRLKGHRIDLFHVVDLHQSGCSRQAIQEEFPTLTATEIAQVIDFYQSHRQEVDQYASAWRKKARQQEAATPRRGPNLVELRRRRQARLAKELA